MEILTLLPPVLALAIAIASRNVYWALGGAILVSETLIASGNPAMGALSSIDRAVGVFASTGNTRILLFCIIIGALITYIRMSGGLGALVNGLHHSGITSTRRRAGITTALMGIFIFVETNVSLLATGLLGRPIFENLKLSRERLAYIIDSTCAPVSVLILLNGWGAFLLVLMESNGVEDPLAVLLGTIPLNIYAWLTILLVFVTILIDRTFGPMRAADEAHHAAAPEPDQDLDGGGHAMDVAVPLIVLVGGALGFMWWTGEGNITAGSGSQSILWSVCLATAIAFLLMVLRRRGKGERIKAGFEGMGELLPAVSVIFMSLALGDSLRELGTGPFIASVAESVQISWAIPALLFVAAGFTSFTTGTSWGTYGILVPIAIPLAIGAGVPMPLAIAAVMGGGVFGDHCSPISDTTIIASFASGCDHLEHVKTQLPYAAATGVAATGVYLVLGLLS